MPPQEVERRLDNYRREHPFIGDFPEEIHITDFPIIPLTNYPLSFFEKYPITPSQNPEDILRQWTERYLYILTRNNYFKSKN